MMIEQILLRPIMSLKLISFHKNYHKAERMLSVSVALLKAIVISCLLVKKEELGVAIMSRHVA